MWCRLFLSRCSLAFVKIRPNSTKSKIKNKNWMAWITYLSMIVQVIQFFYFIIFLIDIGVESWHIVLLHFIVRSSGRLLHYVETKKMWGFDLIDCEKNSIVFEAKKNVFWRHLSFGQLSFKEAFVQVEISFFVWTFFAFFLWQSWIHVQKIS